MFGEYLRTKLSFWHGLLTCIIGLYQGAAMSLVYGWFVNIYAQKCLPSQRLKLDQSLRSDEHECMCCECEGICVCMHTSVYACIHIKMKTSMYARIHLEMHAFEDFKQGLLQQGVDVMSVLRMI